MEEELRVGFEKILAVLLKDIGVETQPKYERHGGEGKTIFKGRPDAVHGQVIIEYEAPGAFASERAVRHARDQLIGYMTEEPQTHKPPAPDLVARLVGVGFDGEKIFFVRHKGKVNGPKFKVDVKAFTDEGPYVFNNESARTFLTHLRGLTRLPLTADTLAEKFGPRSAIAPEAVTAFIDALKNWGTPRVEVFFNEWKRLFGIVYGERLNDKGTGAVGEVARLYGVPAGTELQVLLFAVHTYFALLIKLIAAEILSLQGRKFAGSFSEDLTHASKEEFVKQLIDIEDGGIYAERGITNFLEGDFFRWYLDAFSPRLEEAIREITRTLAAFEPATSLIAAETSRDLLKKLYQYLVPQGLRRILGEFYTPDWLAELVIDEVGYKGDTNHRLLDPACGSGTFLVLAVERAREYGRNRKENATETAKRIVANIWGFDLNPLAVIAARTNYLFALGNLVDKMGDFEIPVYLADSVLWPEESFQGELNFSGTETIEAKTSVGTFNVPYFWIKGKGFLLGLAARVLESVIKSRWSVDEAMTYFKNGGLAYGRHVKAVEGFYREILTLEEQGKNGIWARFLKNFFAPVVAPRFDFVIGNPPWVRWGYLSAEYRAATLGMWKRYGLFSLKGHAARLGGGEKDFSMLFTYAAADYYLRDGGKLGFLITQEVFKAKGAGEGFRGFRLGDGAPLKVLKAHDLVTVQPFEGAANKTAAIFLKKGSETKYPVPYFVWKRKKGVGRVPTDARFDEAKPLLQKKRLVASPVGKLNEAWRTVAKGEEGLVSVQGDNSYQARRGASTEPYGVFWLDVKEVLSNGDLIVANKPGRGKREVPQVDHERIEADLVFPAVAGGDIKRWGAVPGVYVLMAQNPEKSEPYTESRMKNEWPLTYTYLTRFKDILLSRGSKAVREFAEKTAFYAMYGIGPYTVARFKVVWKRMASDLVAAVISQHKTPFGYKTIIPTDTTSIFAAGNEADAHYLCAVVNSTPVRDFIKSYSSAGRGFGAPSVMKHVGIPQFDAKNKTHASLATLSKELHKLTEKGGAARGEISKRETEVDRLVAKLFKIKTA